MVSIWSYIEYFQILKSNENLRSQGTFSWKVSLEVTYISNIAKSIPGILIDGAA